MRFEAQSAVLALKHAGSKPIALTLAELCTSLGVPLASSAKEIPAVAGLARKSGWRAAIIFASASLPDAPSYWLDSPHARAWVCTKKPSVSASDVQAFLANWSTKLAEGFVPADAALLASNELPMSSWDEPLPSHFKLAGAEQDTSHPIGIYAIADNAAQLRRIVEAGVGTVQLRMKRPRDADAAWEASLSQTIRECMASSSAHDAWLYINDHWQLAAEMGAKAVHLGQEDLLALGDAGRTALMQSKLALGISSHSVWELCRARALAPSYIACGPVWPTTTKDMPWRAQGLDNLSWWCQEAQSPVVAIGGILTPEQVRLAASTGASGVCVLRGLGDNPSQTVPALQSAFEEGRALFLTQALTAKAAHLEMARPHPSLDSTL